MARATERLEFLKCEAWSVGDDEAKDFWALEEWTAIIERSTSVVRPEGAPGPESWKSALGPGVAGFKKGSFTTVTLASVAADIRRFLMSSCLARRQLGRDWQTSSWLTPLRSPHSEHDGSEDGFMRDFMWRRVERDASESS